MAKPLGSRVRIRAYVDAKIAGKLLNRRSHSVIIIYVRHEPIIWYSNNNNIGES